MATNNWMVSPRYDMESLRTGRAQPIDVFEDAIRGWILDYASKLVDLKEDHAGMAVMVLLSAYPETIECYLTGTDSMKKSRQFFTNGMKRIFPELEGLVSDEVLGSICDDLRNGLYHGSMLKGTVVLEPRGNAVDYSAEDQLFRINPFEFFLRVREHFAAYVSNVRAASAGDDVAITFRKYWESRHMAPEETTTVAPSASPQGVVTSTAAPMDVRRSIRQM